jgi:nitrate reductase NapE component
MNLTRLIPCSVLFVTRTITIIRANVIFSRMLDEVNSNRAANEQISFLFVNLQFGQVIAEHARLFPTDKKRGQLKISLGIAFALFAVLAIFLAG